MDKKDLEVTLTDDMLIIKCSTKKGRERGKGDFYRREVSTRSFFRTVRLPTEVDSEKVQSSFKDGLLELTLAKIKKSQKTYD